MNLFKKINYLLSTLLILSSFTLIAEDYKVVGYYPNWAIYRNPVFKPNDINLDLVTHINYAFAKVDTAGNISLFDSWADIEYRSDWNTEKPYWGNFRQFYDLKKKYPKLKVLISVGGWTLSDPFSEMAANPSSRTNFVKSAIDFCKKYDLDGIDLDWEYPRFAEHSGRPQDKENFTLLLAELHQAAKKQSPALLVTIAAPAGPQHCQNMEINKIHHYLDGINVMTYDFHGPWGGDEITNHHSGLYPGKKGDPQFCAAAAIQYYLEQGVPSKKLIFGMPLYGRSFANVNPAEPSGLFSTYSGPGTGTTSEVGMRFFYDIKQNLLNSYQLHWDDNAKVPYLYSPQKREFITFDNEESLRLKSKFIKDMHLGGAMVWELGLDTRPSWDGMKAIVNELRSGKKANSLLVTITDIDYVCDNDMNPKTFIKLSDGTRLFAHPHYQYAPGPSIGMEVIIEPMDDLEKLDYSWIYDYHHWLRYMQDGEDIGRVPVYIL